MTIEIALGIVYNAVQGYAQDCISEDLDELNDLTEAWQILLTDVGELEDVV